MSGNSSKYHSKACKITKYIPTWERDKIDVKTKLESEKFTSDYYEAKIKSLSPEVFASKYAELALEVEEVDEYCDSYTSDSPSTLLIFSWDCMCPFLNSSYDAENFSFKQLKNILQIENEESSFLENNRSASIFYSQNKIARLTEEKYFNLGSFIHMNKREKAHIGLCINNVENVAAIENNKLNQYFLENAEVKRDLMPSKKIQLLKSDTTLKRFENSKLSFKNAISNMYIHSTDEENEPYTNIFYFVNPVLNESDTSVLAVKQQVKTMMLKYICGAIEDPSFTLPKFHLISTHIKTGFSCVEYYVPKKNLSFIANKKVMKLYFYFINHYYILYNYFLNIKNIIILLNIIYFSKLYFYLINHFYIFVYLFSKH